MIRTLHCLAAIAAAVLVECMLGNFHIAFPVTICVLWFIGRKFPLAALLAIGFAIGLFFDLLYFHPSPWNLWIYGVSLAAAYLIDHYMERAAVFLRFLTAGIILGAGVIGGNLLLSSGKSGVVLFQFRTLFTILCAPLFLLLLQMLSGKEKKKPAVRDREEKKPGSKKKTPEKSGKRGKA